MKIQNICSEIDFPEKELAYFQSQTSSMKLHKGGYFIREEDVCDRIGLVEKGLLRSYVTTEDKEYNIEFYDKGSFASAFTSFLTKKPTEWTIQALEDTELTIISSKLLDELYKRDSCWTEFGKHIFELQTIKKCLREKSLIREDATARYFLFREQYKEIENRLPQHQIASYLGIQPETLSRIKKL